MGGVGLIVGPGVPAGHHVEGLASQVDIAPTILDLLGDGLDRVPLPHSLVGCKPEALAKGYVL